MAGINGPVIVRYAPANPILKPGVHSHNVTRRLQPKRRMPGWLFKSRLILLVLGLCALGYYGYALGDEFVYQRYENWAFDQQIAGHSAVTFADYLRAQTPFGFLVGPATKTAVSTETVAPAPQPAPQPMRPAEGDLLGRVEISRLNVSAMVREGVDATTLSTAVGHVPSTALPGQIGNFAIAAHRDTLFRGLKDVKKDDLVTFQSSNGTYTYQVLGTKIVRPSDVSVLRSDGGGVIQLTGKTPEATDPSRLLTMITCYPFYYVGAAPKRFIVEAELVPKTPPDKLQADAVPPGPAPTASQPKVKHNEPRHSRGSSHLRHAQALRSSQQSPPPKKRGVLRRLLHIS
jgi:sortase A